jgi:hypothetical protein
MLTVESSARHILLPRDRTAAPIRLAIQTGTPAEKVSKHRVTISRARITNEEQRMTQSGHRQKPELSTSGRESDEPRAPAVPLAGCPGRIQECRKGGDQEEDSPCRLHANSFPAFLRSCIPNLRTSVAIA